MKTLLVGASAALLASAAASAQLADVTGQVQGTVDGAVNTQVDPGLDVHNTIDADANALVDTRSGLQLDARLVNDLGSSLRAHNRATADARLRSELDANASAYAPPPRVPQVSGRSAWSGRSMTQSRLGNDYADVRVYSRDGYHVGNIHRFRSGSGGSIWIEPVGLSSGQRFELSPQRAWFDAGANAVVTDMTRAELDAAAMAG